MSIKWQGPDEREIEIEGLVDFPSGAMCGCNWWLIVAWDDGTTNVYGISYDPYASPDSPNALCMRLTSALEIIMDDEILSEVHIVRSPQYPKGR